MNYKCNWEATAETEDVMEQSQICKYGVILIKNRFFLYSVNLLTPLFFSLVPFLKSFVVFVGFGPGVHVDIVGCKEKNQITHWNENKVPAYGRQISINTSFYLLLLSAGKSVSDANDDEGQKHVRADDAGYGGWLDPVARHRAVWRRCEQTGGGEEWDGEYDLMIVISPLCSALELLGFFPFILNILVYKWWSWKRLLPVDAEARP